jgi:TatD DNase family protein
MYNFFDIHSHFNLDQFSEDREAAIERLQKVDIGTICVGIDVPSSQLAVELSSKTDNIFACIGVHPQEVSIDTVFDAQEFVKMLGEKTVCAGECGLDYFRLGEDADSIKDAQRKVFKEQISFAVEHDLPLMLHIRPAPDSYDAYEEVLDILNNAKQEHGGKLRGNAHFFAGTPEHAKRFNEIGFTVSFTGVITFTDDYNDVVAQTPLDQMFAETDAPFVAPVPHRGKRAEPWMVEEVYKKIAEVKAVSVDEVIQVFQENRKRLFRIQS